MTPSTRVRDWGAGRVGTISGPPHGPEDMYPGYVPVHWDGTSCEAPYASLVHPSIITEVHPS